MSEWDAIAALLVVTILVVAVALYAFTRPGESGEGGPGRPSAVNPADGRMTYTAFAALGITGLRDRDQIAIDHALPPED